MRTNSGYPQNKPALLTLAQAEVNRLPLDQISAFHMLVREIQVAVNRHQDTPDRKEAWAGRIGQMGITHGEALSAPGVVDKIVQLAAHKGGLLSKGRFSKSHVTQSLRELLIPVRQSSFQQEDGARCTFVSVSGTPSDGIGKLTEIRGENRHIFEGVFRDNVLRSGIKTITTPQSKTETKGTFNEQGASINATIVITDKSSGLRYEKRYEKGQLLSQGAATFPDGDRFEGHLDGGEGVYTFKNGDKYKGPCSNWKPADTDKGHYWFAGGGEYEGLCHKGKPVDGDVCCVFPDGGVYGGPCSNGTLTNADKGHYWFPDGGEYEGPCSFGKPADTGLGCYWFLGDDERKYEGVCRNGKPVDGDVRCVSVDGGVYNGPCSNGTLTNTDKGLYEFPDGGMYKGPCVNGKPAAAGKGVYKFRDGGMYEGPCINGKPKDTSEGRYALPGRGVYEGPCSQGRPNDESEGRFIFPGRGVYEGPCSKGEPCSPDQGVFIFPKGRKYEGPCNYGRPNTLRSVIAGLSEMTDTEVVMQRDQAGRTLLDQLLEQGSTEAELAQLVAHRVPYSGSAALPLTSYQRKCLLKMQWRMPLTANDATFMHIPYISIIQTIESLSKEGMSDAFRNARDDFAETINHQLTPAEKVSAEILAGKVVVIPTGWMEHATAVVFAGNLVIKCNRGDGADENSTGIAVYELSSPRPSPEAFTQAIEKLRRIDSQSFFESGMGLGLTQMVLTPDQRAFCYRKPQKGPTCTMSSAKAAFLAVLFATHRDDLKEAQRLYKEMTNLNRQQGANAAHADPELSQDAELMQALRKRQAERRR